MIRGLYTSALGMTKDERRMDVISNNLANINTNGFKKDAAVNTTFSEVMAQVVNSGQEDGDNNIGKLSLGVGVAEVSTDYRPGNYIKTDNPLDASIMNSDLGFFCVDVTSGEGDEEETTEMYTRDGAFTLNSLGQLSTKDGYIVKGENGPITLKGTKISINSDGSVIEDGVFVDKLLVKEFADSKSLKKYGDNLVTAPEDAETKAFEGQILQSSLEASNVNSITEMVDMISVMRSYEANQKVMRAHDETLSKAVNEVGKL